MEALTARQFSFADFELDATRRLLSKHGKPLALKSRTFDLLLALVERKGEVLSKDELLELVWEGQFVEEGNLTVHISALRKLLGETKDENRFIVTVPGRGYSFVADVNNADDDEIIVESHSIEQILVEEKISDAPVTAVVLGPKPTAIDWLKRNKLAVAVAVLGLAAILLGSGYFVRNRFLAASSNEAFQKMSIRRLTSNGHISNAVISPDGKLFIYDLSEGDQDSLWLGHVDGGEPVQIRPPANQVYLSLNFSPDGSSFYYTVSENFDNGVLYKMPVFGGAPEKIRENFRGLTFAPDGKQFAFLRLAEDKSKVLLMTVDAGGTNEREIPIQTDVPARWHSISWAPDGVTIAAVAPTGDDDFDVFLINSATGAVRRLTEQHWRKLESVSWMHDNSGLVATGIEKNTAIPQLWFIPVPGGTVRRLSNDLYDWGYRLSLSNDNTLLAIQGISQSNIWVGPANNLTDAKQITFGSAGRKDGWNTVVWAQDGRIVYTSDTADGSIISIMNSDGSKPKQLIPTGGINNYPSVTSDDRTLVFQSNRTGHFAVWRSDLDGGNMKQLTGDVTAAQPFISPDGKWIIYNSEIDSAGELWRIPAEGGEAKRLIDKPAAWAQISPDSRSVACEIDIEGKERVAILSLETGEVLKSFDIPRLANLRLGIHWTPDNRSITYRDWANGLWRQSLDGGEATRIDGLPQEKLFSYGWSPDGRNFAFTRGSTSRDVVLISGAK